MAEKHHQDVGLALPTFCEVACVYGITKMVKNREHHHILQVDVSIKSLKLHYFSVSYYKTKVGRALCVLRGLGRAKKDAVGGEIICGLAKWIFIPTPLLLWSFNEETTLNVMFKRVYSRARPLSRSIVITIFTHVVRPSQNCTIKQKLNHSRPGLWADQVAHWWLLVLYYFLYLIILFVFVSGGVELSKWCLVFWNHPLGNVRFLPTETLLQPNRPAGGEQLDAYFPVWRLPFVASETCQLHARFAQHSYAVLEAQSKGPTKFCWFGKILERFDFDLQREKSHGILKKIVQTQIYHQDPKKHLVALVNNPFSRPFFVPVVCTLIPEKNYWCNSFVLLTIQYSNLVPNKE